LGPKGPFLETKGQAEYEADAHLPYALTRGRGRVLSDPHPNVGFDR
jgi:hypothetical protein